jgi:hypothetical protein
MLSDVMATNLFEGQDQVYLLLSIFSKASTILLNA